MLHSAYGGQVQYTRLYNLKANSAPGKPSKRNSPVQRTASAKTYRSPYWLFSLATVAIVLVVALPLLLWLNWSWLWSYLVAINVATFVLYGYDKAAAGGGRRVPEIVLHGAELLGGTPAAFVAQRLFHHKTQKTSFQVRFWIIVAVQAAVVLLIWLSDWA
jgi:uncharacterized membrane protein YsdA (DUF1294 family)